MALEYTSPTISIWKLRQFTLLLSASLLLSIGNKIYELLLPLIMYDLSNGSSVVMTSMRTAELLPNLFFGIFIGVIVDRVNKKKWALLMISIQAVVLFLMYFLFGTKLYQPIVYYILGFILMTLNYGFFNTQISLIKFSVPAYLLTSANAKLSFVETFVSIMGPVFLGLVLLFANKTQGILVTVILYIVSYLLILGLTIEEPEKRTKRTSFWLDFKEGWDAFRHNKALKTMTIFIIFINSTMTVVSTTVLIFGTADLKLTNSSLSMILSFAGIGGLVASITINSLRKKWKLGLMFGVSIMMNAFAYLGLYYTDNYYLFAISLVLNGFATTIYIICAYTFRHEQTPANLMGRIGGLTGTLFRIGMPVTMLISGWMISWWGTSSVFLSSAIINLIIFLFYSKSTLWSIK
ncbi:MFS transporter [Bacillus sp. CGMCC 1.16607]|uniref:MFS transporter n=1 Tax=Bacillus sp. CGMCC 1.16607 TaxID=3351842 RepID=UPI00363912DB